MVTDVLSSEDFAIYAERRAIFHALEKAVDGGTGLVMLRQVVAHPLNIGPVETVLVFHHVADRSDAPWPASACGTFFHPLEVADYMADAWGPWVE